MRKIKRKKNYNLYILVACVGILSVMGIGYSYLQETLSINIGLSMKQPIDITNEIVTSGDGLYEDQYEEGRYVYRGSEPNNYIQFNNELWRIIAKETDGTYKIVRDDLLNEKVYDAANNRLTTNNTYCDSPRYGCNAFGKVNGTFTSGNKTGTVTEDSSMAEYLNNTYFEQLDSVAQEQIQIHKFNIGNVIDMTNVNNDSIEKNIQDEQAYQWEGKVGMINVSDYLKATIDTNCKSVSYDNSNYNVCLSYLVNDTDVNQHYWTMNGYSGESSASSSAVWYVSHYSAGIRLRNIVANSTLRDIKPVVFLKSSIELTSGKGTASDPYIIKE